MNLLRNHRKRASMSEADDKQARELGEGLLAQMSRQMPDVNDIVWLVRNGASMHVTDREGMTPLVKAMSWGNKPLIIEMIAHGADVNRACGRTGVTAMQIAASGSDAELVQYMLDHGGDVLSKNGAGRSALDVARVHNHADVLALIEEKAKPSLAEQEATARHETSIRSGLPVEKPFPPLKPLKFRPH